MSAVFERIKAHPKFGRGVALTRCARVMDALRSRPGAGAPQVVHVVGSNGKGTTAVMLSRLLVDAGRRVGLFTSPHIYRFSERFQINNRPPTEARLAAAYDAVAAAIADEPALDRDAFGGFEMMTLMAAALFLTDDVDVAVIEAGIGGRFDPTRVFGGRLAVLTSLDLEHTELLGDTLEAIAADKLDVVGPGATVITGRQDPRVGDFLRLTTRLTGKRLIDVSNAWGVAIDGFGIDGMTARLERRDGRTLPVTAATPSAFALENGLLALEAARVCLGDGVAPQTLEEAFARQVASLTLPVRFEVLAHRPLVVADAAHTPAAVATVAEAFAARVAPQRFAVVLGVSVDKKVPAIAAIAARYGATFIAFAAAQKGSDPQGLAAMLARERPNASVTLAADAVDAAARARVLATSGWPVLALGGLFSAAEFATAWRGDDPTALAFY